MNIKKIYFVLLSCLVALCGGSSLFAGKKKNGPQNDEDVFKKAQLLNKKAEEQKKKQELLKKQQAAEQEQKKLLFELNLLKEYPLLTEYLAYKKLHKEPVSLSDKKIFENYYDWLQEIKKMYVEQETHLLKFLEYGRIFAELEVTQKQLCSAWHPYLKNIPGARFFSAFPASKSKNIEEFILALRYLPVTDQSFFTKADFELLNAHLVDEKTKWIAHAILTTAKFFEENRASVTFGKKGMLKVAEFNAKIINDLPRSMHPFFSQFLTIMDLVHENERQTQNYTSNDQELYKKIQEIYGTYNKQVPESITKDLQKLEQLLKKNSSSNSPSLKEKKAPLLVEKLQPTIDEPKPEKIEEKPSLEIKQEEKVFFEVNHLEKVPFTAQAERVLLWYTNAEKALEDNEKTLGKLINQQHHATIIKRHTFSETVNYFIDALAIPCNWKDSALSYNIPGQIIDRDTNTETTGVFSYGVNKNGVLFHRCFSEQSYQEVEDIVRKRTFEAEFPSLTDEKTSKKQYQMRKVENFDPSLVRQNNFYVEIDDKQNNMLIRLFKLKNQ